MGMACPRCGKIASPGSSFCPNCGQPLTAGRPEPTHPPVGRTPLQDAHDAQRKRGTAIGLVLGVIALVAAGFLGMRAFGALAARGNSPDKAVLNAKGKAPANVLQVKGNTPPPALNRMGQQPVPVTMPPDVYAWLKHLEKCEAMKVEISGDQAAEVSVWMQKMSVLGAGMGLMNPYDQSEGGEGDEAPSSYAQGKILDLRPKWQQLVTFFNSVPPPAECRPIANDFNRAIGEIPGMMGDLGEILNGAMADPTTALQNVKRIQNSSYGDIDRYFQRTDEKVGQICSKYNTRKWFNIKADVLAGGMMGKFGNLGGGL